jgi:hypothetical protein
MNTRPHEFLNPTGTIGTPAGTSTPPKHRSDGAMFTPARSMVATQTMCGG